MSSHHSTKEKCCRLTHTATPRSDQPAPHVGQVRGKGLLYGIEVVEDKKTREPAGAERMGGIISGCKERGLIVGKNGDTTPGLGNVVTICPPLNLTDDDLDFLAGTLTEVFEGDTGERPVRPPVA